MDWTVSMFVSSALGGAVGFWYPIFVRMAKWARSQWDGIIPVNVLSARVAEATGGSTSRKLIAASVASLLAGAVIGLVLAALGFVVLLGNPDNQRALQQTGVLAFFTAFGSGFTAGAAFEEPLKQS